MANGDRIMLSVVQPLLACAPTPYSVRFLVGLRKTSQFEKQSDAAMTPVGVHA
jgi:hypothetical protein